jgi:hypothetical protein
MVAPAPKIAFASPRSEAGNHSRIIRLDAGQLVDSPMPMTTRVPSTNKKFGANPVSTVAADHSPARVVMLPDRGGWPSRDSVSASHHRSHHLPADDDAAEQIAQHPTAHERVVQMQRPLSLPGKAL